MKHDSHGDSDSDESSTDTISPATVTTGHPRTSMIGNTSSSITGAIDSATSGARTTPLSESSDISVPRIMNHQELQQRDINAIAYSKSLLEEGDTLVIITYPSKGQLYDATGFELISGSHRVYSHKLLATGSAKFKAMLGESYQQRIKKRKGVLSSLPAGVRYILDLTPPDEGEEALELTTNLFCSPGIRYWFTAAERCDIPVSICGGKDEILLVKAKLPVIILTEANESTASHNRQLESNSAHTDFKHNTDTGVGTASRINESLVDLEDRQLREALIQSKLEFEYSKEHEIVPHASRYGSVDEVLEYCPIRHRAGIERLLQVIEGKNPRLDSAPKVWTMFALAKFFECTNIVADFITSWVMSQPNYKIIEILPEMVLAMGMGIRSTLLTRAAFSVLVSEEALSIVSRQAGSTKPDKERKNQFGRVKEDVDEDCLGAIQEAACSLVSRVDVVIKDLLHPKLPWFETLPEYRKLLRPDSNSTIQELCADMISSLRHFVRARIIFCLNRDLTIGQSEDANQHRYEENYMGEVNCDFSRELYTRFSEQERLLTKFFWNSLRKLSLYTCSITDAEEVMFDSKLHSKYLGLKFETAIKRNRLVRTTFLELHQKASALNCAILNAIQNEGYNNGIVPDECFRPAPIHKLDVDSSINQADWHLPASNTSPTPHAKQQTKEPSTLLGGESSSAEAEGRAIPMHPKHAVFEFQKPYPQDASPLSAAVTSQPSLVDKLANIIDWKPSFFNENQRIESVEAIDAAVGSSNNAPSATQPITPIVPTKMIVRLPDLCFISASSPFFNYVSFLSQANTHTYTIANQMLSNGDVDFSVLTDTLLCLDDNEFKYLPLWAGGDEDGSGGVFAPTIPPAVAGAGPSGPGPAFHTGYSMPSRTSTESDFDDTSTIAGRVPLSIGAGMSVNTSVAVEDGYSDHIDRRHVKSDDGFHSAGFSDDSETYIDKDNAKMIAYGYAQQEENEIKDAGTSMTKSDISDDASKIVISKGKGRARAYTEHQSPREVLGHDPFSDVFESASVALTLSPEMEEEWDGENEEDGFDFAEDDDEGDNDHDDDDNTKDDDENDDDDDDTIRVSMQ